MAVQNPNFRFHAYFQILFQSQMSILHLVHAEIIQVSLHLHLVRALRIKISSRAKKERISQQNG